MTLNEKVIVVTGAAGGMGQEIVKLLLKKGASVISCDLNTEPIKDLSDNSSLTCFTGDLLNERHVEVIFQKAYDKYGRIDGLVNAAGIAQKATPIEEVSLNEWKRILDINTTMLFLTCREAVKYMKPEKKGSIVNIASISARRPRPGLQAYIASKGGAESFSSALAIELASDQIRVNTIHPGPCDTDMLSQFIDEKSDVNEAKQSIFQQSVPLGKLLQPADIAGAAAFLLSDEASMITGAVLHVDGGRGL